MDIDIVGILVFLWFIFKGLRQGQNAKQEHEQRQRERPEKTKTRPQPVIEERPVTKEEEEAPTVNPFPDWFPFPIPIDIELEEPKPKRKKQSKAKPKPVIEKARKEERRVDREVKKPFILEKPAMPVMPNPIVQGEMQWKNESLGLKLDRKALVNGIILSEILGLPKARRK